jgi:hypothetical protein
MSTKVRKKYESTEESTKERKSSRWEEKWEECKKRNGGRGRTYVG